MAADVTKKVRLTRSDARRLARLARLRKVSEGAVLREGLAMVERQQARSDAIDGMIKLIDGPEPRKVRFRMK